MKRKVKVKADCKQHMNTAEMVGAKKVMVAVV